MALGILLLPSKRVESGEAGIKTLRDGSRVTGGDGFVVDIDDEFLLGYCLPAKEVHAEKAARGTLELDGGFGSGKIPFLVLFGRVIEAVPALLLVPWRMGFEEPVRAFGRTNPVMGGSEGTKETRPPG